MDENKISVIVPIYNIESYIDDCIKSIVDQTYKNLEIILVDDGSTDDSGRIIDEWATKDSRIKVFHKVNGGLGDSRNYGFDNSTGMYICYIDGDDRVEDTYLEKMLEVLKKNDADMSGCRFYRNRTDRSGYIYPRPNEAYRFVATSEELMERLYNDFGVFCIACCKLFKRDIIIKDMFPKVKIAEDAMVMRDLVYRCKKIAYIPDALYMYRDRPGSIMTAKRVYSITNQEDRMTWVVNDIAFYKSIKNNKLQALAEKAYCFYIYCDWNSFDKECRRYYRPRYYKALLHMVVNRGNSFMSKCKYIVFGIKMLFG